MTTEDCLFCKMAAGDIPVDKVHDDDRVFAIRDLNPRAPVHVLVIPRDHIAWVRDLEGYKHGPLLSHMMGVANKVAGEMELAERGYRLTFNVGDEGGQTIYHLHLHLLGGHKLGPEG
jgi:histidine triad (HIT) family protein